MPKLKDPSLHIQVMGSDMMQPRCGCPTAHPDEWNPLGGRLTMTDSEGRPITVAECPDCGAAWEWGEVCAARPERSKGADPEPFTPEAGMYCYYVPDTAYVKGQGYRASLVFENIAGHLPTGQWPFNKKNPGPLPYFWGDDLAEAKAQAARVNRRTLRISRKRAHAIVSRSMGLSMRCNVEAENGGNNGPRVCIRAPGHDGRHHYREL